MPPDALLPGGTGHDSGRWVHRVNSAGIDPGEVVGLILAGGRSSRMGSEKALLRIGGETLIERQLRILRAVGVRDTFLSLRPELIPRLAEAGMGDGAPASSTAASPVALGASPPPAAPTLLLDEEGDLGPLAGIVAAMAHTNDRPILVVAVDMPGVLPSLLSHLLSRASKGCGVAPKIGGMWEPLCAVYPPGALEVARSHLRSESRSPARLLDALAALHRVRSLSLSKDVTRSLRSWNRPEDVASYGTRVPHLLPLHPD